MGDYPQVHIIGAGLAGSEAALQLARAGVPVRLSDMRFGSGATPAHQSKLPAELVCSNSFKGLGLRSAHGLMKWELRQYGAALMHIAEQCRVPAGESLTVDRELFSLKVLEALQAEPLITMDAEEIQSLNPDQWTIIAAGPLCSDSLSNHIFSFIGREKLHFFDAIAPVVDVDSIDMEHAYKKNRWEKGDTEDFINCPLNKEEYSLFVEKLQEADAVEPRPFEKQELFEGCLPLEELARRGKETLRFGPMRPVGLRNELTGEKPWAVLQLRAENASGSLYNLVGCQTRLRWGTQKELFRIIPALRSAEFVRLGAMHRNTFIDSPNVLNEYLQLPETRVFFAGQITGAEGYTEAVATGLYNAWNVLSLLQGKTIQFPPESCLGALTSHLTKNAVGDFQPMNFNFGLLPPIEGVPKKQRKDFQIERTQKVVLQWIEKHSFNE